MKKIVAPLRRVIKLGSKGPDVLAVKRALRKARYLRKKKLADSVMGPWAVGSLKRFQKAKGLKPDGEYGPATHRKLLRYFDSWGAHLMASYHPQDSKAAKAVATAMWAYRNCGHHYTQDMYWRCEAYYKKLKPPQTWSHADCSGFVLWCYWVAGIDTAGPYDGWTGTMQEHGHVVPRSHMQPGDAAFYPNHVAIIVAPGMVVSYGHEGAPFFVPIDYRSDLQEIRRYV